jgi:hypothetical protein
MAYQCNTTQFTDVRRIISCYMFRLKLQATMRPIITGHQPKHVDKLFFILHQENYLTCTEAHSVYLIYA